ncbi:hypothetical protein ACT3SP_09580 [Brachybacterium sp. AOP43-C2-M15]|uniref:hypothetical protein n=1 Tax=Brachybacterium sp. AOP43-C2-M15 TaxID=3457661 RepID=UPI004034A0AC
MSVRPCLVRPSVTRLAGALLALSLLAAGCGESDPAPEESAAAPAASDEGGAEDDGASDSGASDSGASDDDASDGGGRSAAGVPRDPYPVTPAPDDFEAPEPCSGEGAYYAKLGETASPDLPERAGESLSVELTGIEGDHAQLSATIGDGSARPVEDMTLGETATIDLWTISVTSVCADTDQVEFDLID